MRLIIKNSFYAMSLIACMIVGMLCASGCNVQTDSGTSDIDVSTYCNMIQIERIGFTGRVYYDTNTKVMYYMITEGNSTCGLTPIYNVDGTLKLYDGSDADD